MHHSHLLSILREKGRKNIFLPGWYKPDTGLILAWEVLGIFRSQQATHARGCPFRSEQAEASRVPFLHVLPQWCINTRSTDSPCQAMGCMWPAEQFMCPPR